MKIFVKFIAALLLSVGSVYAQTGTLSILNSEIIGTDIKFDIYLRSDDPTPLYLSISNFAIFFNRSKFSNPTVDFDPAPGRLSNPVYGFVPSIRQSNTIAIDVNAPFVTNPFVFNNFIQEISNSGNGTLIGTVTLSGIKDFTGTADLEWRTNLPFHNVVFTVGPAPEYDDINVTLSYSDGDTLELGPRFETWITTQELDGPTYSFDVYMRHTGGPDFYLDDCAIAIDFNEQLFDDPMLTVVSTGTEKFEDFYEFTPSIPGGTELSLVIDAPSADSQTQLEERLQKIAFGANDSTKIATLQISNANTGISIFDIHPAWIDEGIASDIRRRRLEPDWNDGDIISKNGVFNVQPAKAALELIRPNDAFCITRGDEYTIEWTHENVRTIRIELVDTNNEIVVIDDAVDARDLTFEWDSDVPTGVYRVRIVDVANAELTDISENEFRIGLEVRTVQHPVDAFGCEGGEARFNASASGDPAPLIVWQVSATDGATWSDITSSGNELVLNNIVPQQSGFLYRAVFVNICGSRDTSNSARLTVGSELHITEEPPDRTVCEGESTSFSAAVDAESNFAVQWQRRTVAGGVWLDIPNATQETLIVNDVHDSLHAALYRALFTSPCSDDTFSREALLTVNIAPAVTLQIDDERICEGDELTYFIEVTGRPAPAVQWQVSVDAGNSWSDIGGATGLQYTIPFITIDHDRNKYRALVTGECAPPLASDESEVFVLSAPSITLQPEDAVVCAGLPAAFQSAAQATPDATTQWEVSTDGGESWESIADADQETYTISEVSIDQNGWLYRAVFANECDPRVISAVAELTVLDAPTVVRHPTSATVCSGETVVLSVDAVGTPVPVVQWQVQFAGDDVWLDIADAENAQLALPNVTPEISGNRYRAVFANECAQDVVTDAAELTVNPPPTIIEQPNSLTVVIGETAVFEIEAEFVAGGNYQWYRGLTPLVDDERYNGTTTERMTILNVNEDDRSGEYRVIISDECGADTSRFVALNIDVPGIDIGLQPEDVSLCEGGTATFTVEAQTDVGGATLSYQWMLGDIELNEGGQFSGVNTPTLSIADLTQSDAASNYRVRITVMPGGQQQFSNNVGLSVDELPRIIQSPQSRSECRGASAFVEVTAGGSGPLEYEWLHDGQIVPGANGFRYFIDDVDESTIGQYQCRVTNQCGSITTERATIALKQQTIILLHPESVQVFRGDQIELRVEAEGEGSVRYQWFKDDLAIPAATSSRHIIGSAELTDEGEYYCEATAECGSAISSRATVSVSIVSITESIPSQFTLRQNFPNPFAVQTNIPFELTSPARIDMVITNALGAQVLSHSFGQMPMGAHMYTLDASDLPPGVYFYTIHLNGAALTRRMAIVR